MLIAVPNCQGRVSPVFDVASRLLLVRLKGHEELERREIAMLEKQPHGIVQSLREFRIRTLVCGAISEDLQQALERAHIRVLPHICGEVDAVLTAFKTGNLGHPEFRMPGCGAHCWSGRGQTLKGKRARPLIHEHYE